jgi:hypothetical protein
MHEPSCRITRRCLHARYCRRHRPTTGGARNTTYPTARRRHARRDAFGIPYGLPVTNEQARAAAAATVSESREGGRSWKLIIAVVDPAGDLVYFEKMDGAQTASVTIALGKARTAARSRRESRAFYNAYEAGHPYVATLDPSLIASPAGFR